MSEYRRADWPSDEAHGVDRECLQRADQRIGIREVELGKDQPCDGAVEKEVVPLDGRTHRAGDDRAPELAALLVVGKRLNRRRGCRHDPILQTNQ